MTRSYLAFVSPRPMDPAISFRALSAVRACGLTVLLRTDRLLVAVQGIEACLLARNAGVVLGKVHDRHGSANAFDGSAGEVETLTKICDARELTERCWGAFVAILNGPDNRMPRIYHSAFSSLCAYTIQTEAMVVVASDARLLSRYADVRFPVDWATLAFQLVHDDLSFGATCLEGIRELRCGEMLEVGSDPAPVLQRTWNPWRHAHVDEAILDRREAGQLLQRELVRSGDACLHGLGSGMLDLSGGLDSSLLAALTARGNGQIQAVNMYSALTEGDERRYARDVAAHLGIGLTEQTPDAALVDVMSCARPDLPRPYVRSFVQETDRLTMEAAPGAVAFLNGTGGDAVFCHLQSSGPAADVLKTSGMGRAYFRTVRDVAEGARCSIWLALRKSLTKAARPCSQVPLKPDGTFLLRGVGDTLPRADLPWLPPPPGILPGKLEHVRGLFMSNFNLNSFGRADTLQPVYPLMSQPLIEVCLRIPTWHWVGGGYNRVPTREIAGDWLPQHVAWRVSKGGLGQLQRDIFRRNRLLIREMLLDGALQKQGLLDRQALEKALEPDSSLLVGTFSRVLRLMDFEAWVRNWM